MRTQRASALALVSGLSISLLVNSSLAASLPDRLERPARPTPLAAETLLTDVQSLGDQLVMVGAEGHILLAGPGSSLEQAQVPVDLLLTAVHFVDARRGWAVGHDGVVLHSEDGGRSWHKQLDGHTINRLMTAWAEGEVARLEAASAGAPEDEALSLALDNAYFALDDVKAGAESGPSRPLLDVWFRDAREGWVVGAYGTILHTTDGGQTWNYLSGLDNPERLHLNAVLGLADGSLLVAGEGGRLHRSADGGDTWEAARGLSDASLYKLLALEQDRLLVMGFGGVLLDSRDGGRSWQALEVPERASLYGGLELSDGTLLLAGQGGVLLHSRDGQRFRAWRAASRSAWLNLAETTPGQLALVGRDGLRLLPLAEIEEQLQ